MTAHTYVDPVATLRDACAAAGTQRAWARKHGIHEVYVSQTLSRRMAMCGAMMDALGLVRELTGGGYVYRRAA